MFWNPGFIPALPTGIKSVVTVHDLTHLHFYTKSHRLYYNTLFRPLYRCCDLIICVSNFTRNEFLNWSGINENKVVVIPNAIEPNFSNLANPVIGGRPYLFYAGNRRSYKNVPLIVEAFFRSDLHKVGYDLLLTGSPDITLLEIAKKIGNVNNLKFLGFLTDQQLVAYYKGATAVLFLSSYEGFGLPILEAMACGTPILLSKAGAFLEVAGEDAALFTDINSVESVVEGMKSITNNFILRDSLIQNGYRRLLDFSIDDSAELLWGQIKIVF